MIEGEKDSSLHHRSCIWRFFSHNFKRREERLAFRRGEMLECGHSAETEGSEFGPAARRNSLRALLWHRGSLQNPGSPDLTCSPMMNSAFAGRDLPIELAHVEVVAPADDSSVFRQMDQRTSMKCHRWSLGKMAVADPLDGAAVDISGGVRHRHLPVGESGSGNCKY